MTPNIKSEQVILFQKNKFRRKKKKTKNRRMLGPGS